MKFCQVLVCLATDEELILHKIEAILLNNGSSYYKYWNLAKSTYLFNQYASDNHQVTEVYFYWLISMHFVSQKGFSMEYSIEM